MLRLHFQPFLSSTLHAYTCVSKLHLATPFLRNYNSKYVYLFVTVLSMTHFSKHEYVTLWVRIKLNDHRF